MIHFLALCKTHSRRLRLIDSSDVRLTFKPGYNVIVGPNGSGKTSILNAIDHCEDCRIQKNSATRINYITTEKLNPLMGRPLTSRDAMVETIRSLFHSHGQNIRRFLENPGYHGENCILIDTPETGQDFQGCQTIYQGLRRIAETHQVIVVTHHPAFLQSIDNLIELQPGYLEELLRSYRALIDQLMRQETNATP